MAKPKIIEDIENLQLEVTNARDGKANLITKIDEIDTTLTSHTSSLAESQTHIRNSEINVMFPPIGLTGAKGDGTTDDYLALQSIMNYAYDNKMNVYFPKGNYLISKPLVIYGNSTDNNGYNTIVNGAGRDVVNIIKNTNTTLSSGDYAGIDSIIIIGNELTRSGTAITSIWSNQSIAKYIQINNITLKSTASPTRVANGIYSFGVYFTKFFNIGFHNMGTAIKTTRYNCYNTFERLEFNLVNVGTDIWSDISGATTLRFIDCHLNGVAQYGYKIKGHALFENCSNDGGTLTVYYFVCSRTTLINCHSESPACTQFMYVDGNTTWGVSTISLLNCGIIAPLSTISPTFQLNSMSNVHCTDLKITTTQYDGLPTSPQGSLYSAGLNCRMIFDNLKLIGNEYINYVPYSINESEKLVVLDRNHLLPTNHTYMAYVSGAVNSGDYNTSSVSVDNTNKILNFTMSGVEGNGYQGLVFDNSVKMDNYSRLYMKATVTFTNGSNNGCVLRITSNDRTGINSSAVTYNNIIGAKTLSTNSTDYEFYIDINNVFGSNYIEVVLMNLGTVNIKEISLLK